MPKNISEMLRMLPGKIIIIHVFQSVDHNLLASLCGVSEGMFNGDEVIAG